MKKYTSITEFYDDFNESQCKLATPIIQALELFGEMKFQWNMPVYHRTNTIIRKTKNQSRWYFGVKPKTGMLYLGFYDINHFVTQHPHVEMIFDQIQKISGQIRVKTHNDMQRAIALINLSTSL